jgi:hypothetical protein
MLAAVVLILLALVLFGTGFAAHLLWWVFIIAAVLLILGFISGNRGGWWRNRP